MIRLLIDENFNHDVLRGLRLRVPDLDAITAQAAGLKSVSDIDLLAWAAAHQRILVTHDLNTVPKFAYQRANAGEALGGVFIVPVGLPIAEAIDQLVLLLTCSHEREWVNRVLYLPL